MQPLPTTGGKAGKKTVDISALGKHSVFTKIRCMTLKEI